MIQPGTLLIRKGTILPSSMLLKSSVTNDGFSAVQGGAELLQLKAELAQAGWNYFYMGAVEQTVFGKGPKRIASAMNGVAAKMQLKKCNSLQIDAITPHSVLGHFLLEGIRALLSHPARRNLRRRKAVSTVPGRPWLGTDSQIEWAERIKPLV